MKTVGFPIVAAVALGLALYQFVSYSIGAHATDTTTIKHALEVQPDGKSQVLETVKSQHVQLTKDFGTLKEELLGESKKQTKLQAMMCSFQAKTTQQVKDCIAIISDISTL